MDFDFSDDQQALRDAVQRFVEKDYGFEQRRQIVRAGGFSQAAWEGLAGLGLMGLQVPEAHGGLGMGPVEAMVVMEELGRGLVLEPYAQGALLAPQLLSQAPQALQEAWLPRIAGGEALVVLAHQERGLRYRLGMGALRAQGGRLTGSKSLVSAGAHAHAFIVPAEDEQGPALYLVEAGADGLTARGHALQDGSAAAELQLRSTPGQRLAGAEAAQALLELAADTAIAAQAAEAVGAMDALVRLTADYLNTRKQFGVAIASFQALRHRMADVKMQLELARSMSYFATLKLGEAPPQRRRALAQVKVQLSQSMRFVGQQCTQLHGGIGVTDEYISSHFFKRLTVMELQWGDGLHHLAEVSGRMTEQAGVFA
ncbi:acyl-CoA dehydrogenase family protein [Pelomonas sp. APW6]|uniref:Acyl-CoA dehydrogenase family protein n=1 Tax=Roseateles subflavus TaxID=3053353 RepID=A0ABT7LMT9_9BURK|nr:acyl-CoA dehydrogenase family protein [Pelomonas sp. APW6]MDL5034186.1 acyl-CoA dehydrogenase family protein [Pelomonas sp. APW6]